MEFSRNCHFQSKPSAINSGKLLQDTKITVGVGLVNETLLVTEDNEPIRARFIDLSETSDLQNDAFG